MQILIATPYPLNTSNGNTITAKRIQTLLESNKLYAKTIHTPTPPQAEILINLHATRTYPTAKYFKNKYPSSKLITLITGTDLNSDLPNHHPDIIPALELADQIILPSTQALKTLPSEFHHKTIIIPASIIIPKLPETPPLTSPYIILPSHLREVKNPFLINRTLASHPNLNIQVYTLGSALEPSFQQTAKNYQTLDHRFHYLGETPHPQTLTHIKNATLTLNTSHQEGGPNTIAESITLGTPVLASAIPGNIGMLGENYPGLFTPNSEIALAELIQKYLADSTFKNLLLTKTKNLAPKFNPTQEAQSWLTLVSNLTKLSP